MSHVRETCSCAATFDGDSFRVGAWRIEHRHEFPPPPELEAASETYTADHTGTHHDAGVTNLYLGFTNGRETGE